MKQEVTNFARFYAAFNPLSWGGDKDELKRKLVLQYTSNRTDSLREMRESEYRDLCRAVEKASGTTLRENYMRIMRQKRSAALHQMQRYGVDTSDWKRVDAFCLDSRIAGKVFRQLDGDELDALTVKLRIMRRKAEEKK